MVCRGCQDSNNALTSRYVIHDGLLTTNNPMSIKLGKLFNACLSAGATASSADAQLNRSIPLTAEVVCAGFESVNETNWLIELELVPSLRVVNT